MVFHHRQKLNPTTVKIRHPLYFCSHFEKKEVKLMSLCHVLQRFLAQRHHRRGGKQAFHKVWCVFYSVVWKRTAAAEIGINVEISFPNQTESELTLKYLPVHLKKTTLWVAQSSRATAVKCGSTMSWLRRAKFKCKSHHFNFFLYKSFSIHFTILHYIL